MSECPTCKRTDFASERAMKIHHKQAHGVSLVREEQETIPDDFPELLRHIDNRIKTVEEKFDLNNGLDDISDPLV